MFHKKRQDSVEKQDYRLKKAALYGITILYLA